MSVLVRTKKIISSASRGSQGRGSLVPGVMVQVLWLMAWASRIQSGSVEKTIGRRVVWKGRERKSPPARSLEDVSSPEDHEG